MTTRPTFTPEAVEMLMRGSLDITDPREYQLSVSVDRVNEINVVTLMICIDKKPIAQIAKGELPDGGTLFVGGIHRAFNITIET